MEGPDQKQKNDQPPPPDTGLQPVTELIRMAPAVVQTYYEPLLRLDRDLGEIFRLSLTGAPTVEEKKQLLSPLQARVSRTGQVWVDVLVELKNEIQQDGQTRRVTLEDARRLMRVHGKPSRRRILSGQAKVENLPQLLGLCNRLQTGRPVAACLHNSVQSMAAHRPALEQLVRDGVTPSVPTGKGVIIGIVDVGGCDFRHLNFIREGKSRLLSLWDQNGRSGQKPAKYGYGVEFDQTRINLALQAADPYLDLNYRPNDAAHGTHVMDIAAGSSVQVPGVAPEADLIYVDLGQADYSRVTETGRLGSSKCLIDAVTYIFEKAGDRPAVVNISLGANGGAHDGTSLVEASFDSLLRTPDRAIVIAAGNSYADGIHAHGIVTEQNKYTLDWLIPDHRPNPWRLRQELEIWYRSDARLVAKLIDPLGKVYGVCGLQQILYLSGPNTLPMIMIQHLRPDRVPGEDENLINVFIDQTNPSMPTGFWKIELSLDPATAGSVEFHAWVERNEAQQSSFMDHPTAVESENQYTLNSLANGSLPIVVGAYDDRYPDKPIAVFSSSGPSRSHQPGCLPKPDLCAPGEHIYAARALSGGVFPMGGTSMAAPHITGLIALMFQVAKEVNPNYPVQIQDIRQALFNSAEPFSTFVSSGSHHLRYGFGYPNARKAIAEIRKTV